MWYDRSMKKLYNDLGIKVEISGREIIVPNIVSERFIKPMPKHSHGSRSYEVHYIAEGYGRVNVDEMPYDIVPGTLYVTGPHIQHEQIPDAADPMVEYTLYFKMQKMISKKRKCKESLADKFEAMHFWFGRDSQNIFPIIEDIFFEMEYGYTGYEEQIKALLEQFIVKMVRNYEQKMPSKRRPRHIIPEENKDLIVEESFLYEYASITLKGLSEKLSLSQRQTQRFIKERYDKTFQEKKAEGKMSMAKILLKNEDLSITEIAEQLDYSSVQHFSHAFRKFFGYSPSSYRKRSR